MTWDLMAYLAPRRDVVFVGGAAPDGLPENVRFLQTTSPPDAPAPIPLLFRRSASCHLRNVAPRVTLSMGVIAPPTDVLWAHSVHRAWLRVSRSVPSAGSRLPRSSVTSCRGISPCWHWSASISARSRPRAIICTFHREVDDLAEIYGVDPAVTRVLPSPFDPEMFNAGRRAKCRAEARARLRVKDGEVALLFVANERHRKGFAEALAALADVGDDRLSLHIVGRTPPTGYGATMTRLGLTHRVHYHGATDDVGWWLAGADLLLLPRNTNRSAWLSSRRSRRRPGHYDQCCRSCGGGSTWSDRACPARPVRRVRTCLADSNCDRCGSRGVGQAGGHVVGAYRRDHVMARVEEILLPE